MCWKKEAMGGGRQAGRQLKKRGVFKAPPTTEKSSPECEEYWLGTRGFRRSFQEGSWDRGTGRKTFFEYPKRVQGKQSEGGITVRRKPSWVVGSNSQRGLEKKGRKNPLGM